MTGAKNSFSSIGEILKTHLDQVMGEKLAHTLSVQKNWPRIVGQTIAKHSKVLYVKDKLLCVGVENSTWLNELTLMKDKIKDKIKEMKIETEVTEIKFKSL